MKEFLAYYRAATVGNARYGNAKRGSWNLEIFLIIVSGLLVAAATACLNNTADSSDATSNFSGSMYMYGSLFMYVLALSMGVTRRDKPSVLSIAPIKYKKRAVFSHLTVLLGGLVFFAVWIAVMLAFMLLISLITLIFTGDWVFLLTFENNAGIAVYPDVQGALFAVAVFIALFGAGMAISYTGNKKTRYAMLFVCPAVLGAVALLVANMSTNGGKFVICNNMLFNFKNLPLSWLWLTVFAVIAIAMCAVSLCLAIKYEKPKQF